MGGAGVVSGGKTVERVVRRLVVGLGNPGSKFIGTRHNVGFAALDRFAERSVPKLSLGGHDSMAAAVALAAGRTGASFELVKSVEAELASALLCFETGAASALGHDAVDRVSDRRRRRTAQEGVPYPRVELTLMKPTTSMNLSGTAVRKYLDRSKFKLKNSATRMGPRDELVVVYDDVGLPFGTVKLSPKGGHGGQNGLRHIMERTRTDKFARVRIGVGPTDGSTPPQLVRYVLGRFTPSERDQLPATLDHASEILRVYLHRGFSAASNLSRR